MPTCYVQFYCCHCTYVIHDNKIIFIVIVIVIVIVILTVNSFGKEIKPVIASQPQWISSHLYPNTTPWDAEILIW